LTAPNAISPCAPALYKVILGSRWVKRGGYNSRGDPATPACGPIIG